MAQEPKSLDEITSQGNEKKETLRERNMRAALERAEQAEAEKKAAEIAFLKLEKSTKSPIVKSIVDVFSPSSTTIEVTFV